MKVKELKEWADLTVDEKEAFDSLVNISADSEITIDDVQEAIDTNTGEIADGMTDVYTSDLLDWYSADLHRTYYADQAIKELGADDFSKILTGGQYLFWQEILSDVQRKLETTIEGIDSLDQLGRSPEESTEPEEPISSQTEQKQERWRKRSLLSKKADITSEQRDEVVRYINNNVSGIPGSILARAYPNPEMYDYVLAGGEDLSEADGYPIMWGTLWLVTDSILEDKIRAYPQKVAEFGFTVFDLPDEGLLLGINGASYDFYEAHWFPLMQWDRSEESTPEEYKIKKEEIPEDAVEQWQERWRRRSSHMDTLNLDYNKLKKKSSFNKQSSGEWMGSDKCDFCGVNVHTVKEFYDAKTNQGPWALMCPKCYSVHGVGQLGEGSGQKYDGKTFKKIEGSLNKQLVVEGTDLML